MPFCVAILTPFLSLFLPRKILAKRLNLSSFKRIKFLNLSKNETKIMLKFQIQKRKSKRNKMKKLVLVAILGLCMFVAGWAIIQTAKTNEVSSTAKKTDEMSSSATKANFEDLSDEQFKQF